MTLRDYFELLTIVMVHGDIWLGNICPSNNFELLFIDWLAKASHSRTGQKMNKIPQMVTVKLLKCNGSEKLDSETLIFEECPD